MAFKEVEIGRLVEVDGGRIHRVLAWEHYGVVCPGLVTTNGSCELMAQFIRDSVATGQWQWQGLLRGSAPPTREHLIDLWREAFRED